MRLPWLALASLLTAAGCKPERDAADLELDHQVQIALAIYQAIEENVEERRAEQNALRKRIDPFTPQPTAAELVALAGPGAILVKDVKYEVLRDLYVSAPGGKAAAFDFVRKATERSKAFAPSWFKFEEGKWEAGVVLITMPPPEPPRFKPLSSDTSYCWSECQQRRARITAGLTEVAALERRLGEVAFLQRDQAIAMRLRAVQEKLAGPACLPVFERLKTASWLRDQAEMLVIPQGVRILKGSSAGDVDSCAELMAGVGRCAWDPKVGELSISFDPK